MIFGELEDLVLSQQKDAAVSDVSDDGFVSEDHHHRKGGAHASRIGFLFGHIINGFGGSLDSFVDVIEDLRAIFFGTFFDQGAKRLDAFFERGPKDCEGGFGGDFAGGVTPHPIGYTE